MNSPLNGKTNDAIKAVISFIIIALYTYLIITSGSTDELTKQLVYAVVAYWFAGKEFTKSIVELLKDKQHHD